MRIVILGLSITSTWDNSHATVYRALVRGLSERGHSVLFLERALACYGANRGLPRRAFGRTVHYHDLAELHDRYSTVLRAAELIIVGSRVPDGAAVCDWALQESRGITAFYDLDTPDTLARLTTDDEEYISREAVPRFDLYLSSTGGAVLAKLEELGAQRARAFYSAVDTQLFYPDPRTREWHLGYAANFSDNRQQGVERYLLDVARIWPRGRFVVVGSNYPDGIVWPRNVSRVDSLSAGEQRGLYNAQCFSLNLTSAEMMGNGFCPDVHLFQAAACGTPIITDQWPGLETFFEPGKELLTARDSVEVRDYLRRVSLRERTRLSVAARRRCIAEHSTTQRAAQLEGYVREVRPVSTVVSLAAD